jgi:hypothetical protein
VEVGLRTFLITALGGGGGGVSAQPFVYEYYVCIRSAF